MTILAKKLKDGKTQTLLEHTLDVVKETFSLVDDDTLNLVCNKCNFPKDKMLDLLFFAAYFHDIGKATEEFRKTINHNTKSFHSLYSAGIVSEIRDFELNPDYEAHLNLLFLAILTHHQIYWSEIFAGIEHDKKFEHTFLKEASEFFYDYKYHYKMHFGVVCNYNLEYNEISRTDLGYWIDSRLRDDISDIFSDGIMDKANFRLLYSYILGILNLADWIASAKFQRTCPVINFGKIPKKSDLIIKLEHSLKIEKFTPKEFQGKLSKIIGSVLVEIPTGEGKTEGAYLWAINNLKNKKGKIIYTLPTQTTSNKLFLRTKSIFGEETGLIHGSAKLYLEDIYLYEHEEIDDNFLSDLLFGKTFNKPVTVSTIDALLKYFINIGRYNIAMINILSSRIIIDEVHSYDLKLLGFLKKILEITEEYNIPVCIMSATIPNQIKDRLNINKFQYITDKSLFKKKANCIVKIADRLENGIDQIVKEFKSGKNVIVVRNKISSSVEIYKRLKGNDININNLVLYNSQFKKVDRARKEDDIYKKLENKEHFILIATQVVEISLDIDFDVMFTDVAPIDSLIQRFGRVNRKKLEEKVGTIYIYSSTDIKPYKKEMLDLTFKIIEEGLYPIEQYNVWLNKVYDLLFEDISLQRELQSKFEEGYKEFEKNLERVKGIGSSKDTYNLRDIEFPKKDYLLKDDYLKKNDGFEFTVSMAAWISKEGLVPEKSFVYKRKDVSEKVFYDVLDLEYSYDEGVIFSEKFIREEAGELFL